MGIRKKSKLMKWIMIGIIAAGLTSMAAFYLMKPATVAYKSVKAQTGDITTFYSFSGNVSSKNRQTLLSDQPMQVSKIHVAVGDRVEEGECLVTTTAGVELKSKISGEVVTIYIQEDMPVGTAVKLVDVVDFNRLEISFRVDEYDVGALETGMEALVTISAISKEIKGRITNISKEGQIVNGVTFFTANIDIDQDDRIRTGMSAEVKVLSDRAHHVVVIPMNVIQFDEQNQPYVLKSDNKKQVVKSQIETGINDGVIVEIKEGVTPGEDILYKKSIALEEILFPEGGKNTKVHFGGKD